MTIDIEQFKRLEECLSIVDEAYAATGYAKIAKTSEQRLRIERACAAIPSIIRLARIEVAATKYRDTAMAIGEAMRTGQLDGIEELEGASMLAEGELFDALAAKEAE